jgi:amidase
MNIRSRPLYLLILLTILKTGCSCAPSVSPLTKTHAAQKTMDRDLLEVTVPRLEQLYQSHKYTVCDVVRWYLARIEKYNGI